MQQQGSALAPFTYPVTNLNEATTWLESLPGIYQMHETRMAWKPFFDQCKSKAPQKAPVVIEAEADAELDALFQPE